MLQIDFNKYPLPTRKRHHTNPNYYIPVRELKIIPHGYPPIITNINWSDFFINGKPPNKIDIGCGRGYFLLSNSLNEKNENILGVEVRKWCCEWLNNYIKNEKIDNCGIMNYCVANGLNFIEYESIKEIFYLFPDPWIKQKHKKRRAFNEELVSDIYDKLKKNGQLYIATDLIEIHNYHLKLLKKFAKFDFVEIKNDNDWNKSPTNKELFCKKENIQYYRIIAKK